jgi:Zn finger protein HypA/HybF involved in hydrogenase expression
VKLVAYPLAALLGVFGLMFVVGSQGQVLRIVVGAILLAAAGALIWLALQKPKPSVTTIVQKIDLSGDVKLASLTCRSCGGTLSKESVSVKAGGVFVNCPYCGAAYQIEEEPKW